MGYFLTSPQDADMLRAKHEIERKDNITFAAVFAGVAVLGLLAVIVVSYFGWDAKFSILGASVTLILGLAAFGQYVDARDAQERRNAVKTEWVDSEPRIGEHV